MDVYEHLLEDFELGMMLAMCEAELARLLPWQDRKGLCINADINFLLMSVIARGSALPRHQPESWNSP